EQCNRLLATCYQQLGDQHRALAVYQRWLARQSRSVDAQLGVATTLAILGRSREAEDQYRKLLALPGSSRGALVDIARLVFQRNLTLSNPNWDEVDEAVREAERLSPRPPALALLRAEERIRRGHFDEARNVLASTILSWLPVSVGLSRPELALAAALPPPRPLAVLWVALAEVEERAGSPGAALARLDEVARRFGDIAEVRVARIRHWERRSGPDASKALAAL